jgi:hypothetical protein
MTFLKHTLHCVGAGLVLAATGPVLAQTQGDNFPSARELRAFLSERLPVFLRDDNTKLVGQLLAVPIAAPLRSTFDPNKAIKAFFGDGSVVLSTDCRKTGTPVNERDPGDCTASIGEEAGAGAFTKLSYSKNRGFGNIRFLKRPPVPTVLPDPDKLPSPALSDPAAYEGARKLLVETFGLPDSELPSPPAGAKGLPVRSLIVQGGGETTSRPIVIQKTVFLQRGFALGSPIPVGNFALTHVPGPGKATVSFDADGVANVAVQGWQELQLDPTIVESDAKSGSALLDEIAEDLFADGLRNANDIKFGILISSDQRNHIGYLLPAVQVAVLPAPKSLDAKGQEALAFKATGGIVKEYSLVNRKELTPANRPKGE